METNHRIAEAAHGESLIGLVWVGAMAVGIAIDYWIVQGLLALIG